MSDPQGFDSGHDPALRRTLIICLVAGVFALSGLVFAGVRLMSGGASQSETGTYVRADLKPERLTVEEARAAEAGGLFDDDVYISLSEDRDLDRGIPAADPPRTASVSPEVNLDREVIIFEDNGGQMAPQENGDAQFGSSGAQAPALAANTNDTGGAADRLIAEPVAAPTLELDQTIAGDLMSAASEVSAFAEEGYSAANTAIVYDDQVDGLTAGLTEMAAQSDHLSGFADPRYTKCLTQSFENAGVALGDAEDWRQNGGGTAALHCTAYAKANLGENFLAAELFDVVGSSLAGADPSLAASAYVESGKNFGAAARDAMDQGEEGLARTNLQLAIDAYESSLVYDPYNPDNHTDYAILLGEFGYSQEAIAMLDQALGLDNDNAPALWLKGLINLDRGRIPPARRAFEALVVADPVGAYGIAALAELEAIDAAANGQEVYLQQVAPEDLAGQASSPANISSY